MKKKTLTKRQKAIIALLQKLESEGTEYAFFHYGMDDYLEELGDAKLTEAAAKAISAWSELDKAIKGLETELEKQGIDPRDLTE